MTARDHTAESTSAQGRLEQARALYRTGDYADGLRTTAAAVAAFPEDPDLWNIHGVMLRQLRRPHEALAALERALALKPDHPGARVNAGNVLLDLGEAGRAETLFRALADADPGQAPHRVGLGRALVALGRGEAGRAELRRATELDPRLAAGWLHLAEALNAQEGADAALAVLDEGLAATPGSLALLEGKAVIMRRLGDEARMERFFHALVAEHPDLAWAHVYLGDALSLREPDRAEAHLRRALELDPRTPGPLMALAQHLSRTSGKGEGAALDEASRLARRALALGGLSPAQVKVARNAFVRVCDFEAVERLGALAAVGRRWAEAGEHMALLAQLPAVVTDEDRLELVEQHRIVAARMMAEAERRPIRHPQPRTFGPRIRLGFLSADLRNHPVGYFAEPLFAHRDPQFEIFCYAVDPEPGDARQAEFARRATVFRRLASASAHEVAQTIADDDLDVLVELGGATQFNKPEVLAWRPARAQVSWLGYPHPSGLPTVDGFVCDVWNQPTDPRLSPDPLLVMPNSWIALGEGAFAHAPAVDPQPPEVRNGFLTFGTANNGYKYTRRLLIAWASITAETPSARFMFVRPESASWVFRDNVQRLFAEQGVAPERLVFRPVRGGHMGFYNQIDLSLDTFPLTGGTTTLEALWMGVPVVSLRGKAFYERLSASILANAGLPELVADSLEAFRATALRLIRDPAARADLRRTLRPRLQASPLCDGRGFARDFYSLMKQTAERAAQGERQGPGKQS